jgi:DNA-binding MarR family transcriptional regulator
MLKKGENMNNEYYSLVKMMIDVNRLHRRAIEYSVDKTGVHRSQHYILMKLAAESFSSQKAFAKSLNISPAAVTLALSKLEENGYIKRTVGADTRFNKISITDKGKAVVANSRAEFNKVDEAMFASFSDEELVLYRALAEKMQNNLHNYIEGECEK